MVKKYCIYKITNKVNGKTYVGQHQYKDLNDNYIRVKECPEGFRRGR